MVCKRFKEKSGVIRVDEVTDVRIDDPFPVLLG